ncbi:multifunctional CCA addition/repair protein [Vibrio quintilis]|uniref:Multifunctional CCA protein n=1 Tax=Vibrio quintilis TaxID=1117707 RepID=A0A1M7Z358_9VIBR|nr:multifunctional CCA addition/repair protein [Vibrio quintilis]SHO59086.1 Multifunctional CCA protein [Vibrio quintilis]
MKVYLVGGAVRDSLLGIQVHDRDWVVTGSTPEKMLEQGFIAVGKDFPVFLHPQTKEEYALARTERKSGAGYKGFDCFFAPDVSIEEDLRRRDLTINAIAKTKQQTLIDPYNGRQDIESRLLRHVSEAFTEDPVRVLRVARFAAKLASLSFTIAPETMALMQQMVQSGELSHLTPERVWQEFNKALSTKNPAVFLSVLRECGALAVIFPEIDQLFGVPQPEKWHPEIDTGIHTLMVAQKVTELSDSLPVRFAAIVHDLGKGTTPEDEWPSHKKHHLTGLKLIQSLCQRIRVPSEYRDLALLVCEHHSSIHHIAELSAEAILHVFNQIDVWRKPQQLQDVLLCCQADYQGRSLFEGQSYPQRQVAEKTYQAALSINIQDIVQAGFQGQEIREELNRRRTDAIRKVIS